MLSTWVLLVFFCPLVGLYIAASFFNNVRKARKTGLPYAFSPINEYQKWAYITDPLLRWACARYLMKGQGWPKWARFMVKDWMYEDKGRAHKEFADVFLVVSPGGIVCYVANAKTASSVCARRKDFVKPKEKMAMLEPFGPNVVSTDGDLWRFHVRITVPPFGDALNSLVWSETSRQTNMLASSWASAGSGDLKTDIYTLTVNVMSCAGFGQQADWTNDASVIPMGHNMTLVSSIYGVVTYLPHILLLPKWLLRRSPWKIAYNAYVEFDKYMRGFLAVEKAALLNAVPTSSSAKGNLLTAILKSNLSNGSEKKAAYNNRTSLTDEEITGNTFIFLLAGYDTTANTIIFSSIALALHSEVQDELIAEIDRIYGEAEREGRLELSYTKDLPKFRYLLAFMYEVMRVFPIVIPIGRVVTSDQELDVECTHRTGNEAGEEGSSRHLLPAKCGVIVNNTGVHYNTKYWQHPHILEPRRWLSASPNTYDPTSKEQGTDPIDWKSCSIPNHMKGTFLTFSEGPRACMGKKFAQAEFVAFFAHLLREYRMQLAGDVPAEEVDRAMRLRSGGSPVTLVPPEAVKLSLVRRTKTS